MDSFGYHLKVFISINLCTNFRIISLHIPRVSGEGRTLYQNQSLFLWVTNLRLYFTTKIRKGCGWRKKSDTFPGNSILLDLCIINFVQKKLKAFIKIYQKVSRHINFFQFFFPFNNIVIDIIYTSVDRIPTTKNWGRHRVEFLTYTVKTINMWNDVTKC